MSQDELQALLERATQLLESHLTLLESGQEVSESEEWQRCFGKESVVGVLAKLVAMHKQLRDQEETPPPDVLGLFAPMSAADWELLERCVARWKAGEAKGEARAD